MKVGDRIYCKLSNEERYITKGKCYTIDEISGTPDLPLYFFDNDLVGIVKSPRSFCLGYEEMNLYFDNKRTILNRKLKKIKKYV